MRRGFVAVAIATGLALSACGGAGSSDSGMNHGSGMATGEDPSTTAQATFNDADVMFAQMMIPHHTQAVEMADMAATRAADGEVKALAARIRQAQEPEIRTMTDWLSRWGRPAASPGAGMNHGGSPMPGEMSEVDMKALTAASGTAFDKQFLTMMVAHHEGAITMARQEMAQGSNQDATALAARIVQDQQAEITEIDNLLRRL
ncbi:DUF305 domain-containing protein [Asanoa iriomotensis]|nr:DUF305 domain-containing protein [Asanoa iriomotensis]